MQKYKRNVEILKSIKVDDIWSFLRKSARSAGNKKNFPLIAQIDADCETDNFTTY
jgi:hypothetical protein